jgi:hypothetical protein
MKKANLDSILAMIRRRGFKLSLTRESCGYIADCGFRSKTLPLAIVATNILLREQPLTLRGLFYRVVSAGLYDSTDRANYLQLGRVMTTLREDGVVPFSWLVDGVRETLKPSSWSGLADFADTVRDAYRKDFWATAPDYVHVIVEKDAMAGVLESVTRQYDVALSVIRGYVSLSFAHRVAEVFDRIEKPIHCYYLGDLDPSGLDLEQDLRGKLERYCERPFTWQRLGVNVEDLHAFNLYPLAAKQKDRRTKAFLAAGYRQCAELDAIPATALRERLEAAILAHVPAAEWESLRMVEQVETASWHQVLDSIGAEGVT